MTQTSVTLFLPLLLQVVHHVSPVVINFLSIVISMGWTTGTFTVSGWSGKRERVALVSGPLIATTGLACLTAVALLPGLALMTVSAFVMGIGIGVYNVHLVARAMDSVSSGEHRTTAAALTSVRSIGTAFGAAIAGVVANAAGLGDATEPGAVGHAVTAVNIFCCIPFGLAALFNVSLCAHCARQARRGFGVGRREGGLSSIGLIMLISRNGFNPAFSFTSG